MVDRVFSYRYFLGDVSRYGTLVSDGQGDAVLRQLASTELLQGGMT
ncbi:hypothetical protein [Oscillatoria sp. CS-180]|nr:hypothetical protein [Oscillatoria sp. CS-180]